MNENIETGRVLENANQNRKELIEKIDLRIKYLQSLIVKLNDELLLIRIKSKMRDIPVDLDNYLIDKINKSIEDLNLVKNKLLTLEFNSDNMLENGEYLTLAERILELLSEDFWENEKNEFLAKHNNFFEEENSKKENAQNKKRELQFNIIPQLIERKKEYEDSKEELCKVDEKYSRIILRSIKREELAENEGKIYELEEIIKECDEQIKKAKKLIEEYDKTIESIHYNLDDESELLKGKNIKQRNDNEGR